MQLLSGDTGNTSHTLVVFTLILSVIVFASIATTSFAQSSNNANNNDNNNSLPPTIQIIRPSYCTSTVNAGEILVQGNANSSNGISKVEAFEHSYPFNGQFPFLLAEPVSPGNWSSWSVTLDLLGTGAHRILAKVTDNNGRENWDEVIVNVVGVAPVDDLARSAQETDSNQQDTPNSSSILPSSDEHRIKKRIAFVEPTFTDAAYNVDGFYEFYFKYPHIPEGVNVTTDLNLMTAEIPQETDRRYFMPFVERLKNLVPDAEISIIRDQDVHKGALLSGDGTNSYDVLLLLHNEYVTQEEYDSFRNFVKNGGTIIFIDSNIFYAEVTYDEDTCSVTLVKGHDWEFDGTVVRKSVSERYFEENKEWMGSNFVVRDIRDPVIFGNNPFNYTHFEENYVTNASANILIDYNATFMDIAVGESSSSPAPSQAPIPLARGILRDLLGQNNQGEYLEEQQPVEENNENKRIATYELQHGEGKVLMLGIYGQNLFNNTRFLNFFDNIILTRAIGIPGQVVIGGNNSSATFTSDISNPENDTYHNDIGTTYYSKMNSGVVDKAVIDTNSKTMKITLTRYKSVPDSLVILLPKFLIETHRPNSSGNIDSNFIVTIDGSLSTYDRVSNDIETALIIPLSADSKIVEIAGAQMIPEFSIVRTNLGIIMIIMISVIFFLSRVVSNRLLTTMKS